MRREAPPTLKSMTRLSAAERDVVYRRSAPFLIHGLHLPIEHILGEAYLQGVRDAMQCMEARP